MATALFALLLLVVKTSEASTLTIEGKSLSVETGANVSTVSNTLRSVSIIKCVGECMLGTCNMVGYHKPTKTCFISTDMSFDVISVSDPSYRVVNILGRILSQWVDGVFAFSSEYTNPLGLLYRTTHHIEGLNPTFGKTVPGNDIFKYLRLRAASVQWNAASEVVGEPDVSSAYESSMNAWSPANSNSNEFIEVSFSTTVKVTSLEIYESLAAGVVTAIKCFQDGAYHSIYIGEATPVDVARIFSPILAAPCVSNRLRVEVFSAKTPLGKWLEIDAIRLNGTLV